MVACPHCEFENPLQNRFCQQCGKALRTVQAVLLPANSHQTVVLQVSDPVNNDGSDDTPNFVREQSEMGISSAAGISSTPLTVATFLTSDYYLRSNRRYRLQSPTAAEHMFDSPLMVNLIDCEPGDEAPITQLVAAKLDADETVDFQQLLPNKAWPYWQLQEHFYPMVPELQAAWQEEQGTIILLEDRSIWTALEPLIEATQVEPLELVHWLYEVVSLWEALTHFKAEASLLNVDNLWIDDDQILCIQRLIYRDRPCSLEELGKFWQALLGRLPNPCVPALANLVADMGTGVIADVATIEELLANIAENLQEMAEEDEQTAPRAAANEPATPATAHEIVSEALLDTPILDEIEAIPVNPERLSLDEFIPTVDLTSLEEPDNPVASGDDAKDELPTVALPMSIYRLDEVGRTHVGRQRAHNEDSFFADTQLQRLDSPAGSQLQVKGLYILCDGMGGHSGGEVASNLAVETLRDYWDNHWQTELPNEATIKEAILQANQAIFDKNDVENREGNARMGTTLVMVLIADNRMVVAHVGDSRLYGLTRKGLSQITTDHEVGQREIDRGVEPAIAYARPDAYQLTQALGPRSNSDVNPTIQTLQFSQDTLLLLCSDGISDNEVLEKHVDSHVEPLLRSRYDLEEGVANLISLANEHNGHDNITVVAVRIKMRPNLGGRQAITHPPGSDDLRESRSL